jgi:hypothetical protein
MLNPCDASQIRTLKKLIKKKISPDMLLYISNMQKIKVCLRKCETEIYNIVAVLNSEGKFSEILACWFLGEVESHEWTNNSTIVIVVPWWSLRTHEFLGLLLTIITCALKDY